MNIKEHLKNGFGLFQNFGWKRNLLAIAAGFLCCLGSDMLISLLSSVRVLSEFSPLMALLPFIGFLLGIWGLIGVALKYMIEVIQTAFLGMDFFAFSLELNLLRILYSALPAVLWYLFSLKESKKTRLPRLDTSAHVIRYYLIMILSVLAYLVLMCIALGGISSLSEIREWAVVFSQCLNTVLILGIPILLIVSRIRNRTITINERLVLAFLTIGIIASALGALLVYQTTLFHEPELFENYDRIMLSIASEFTDAERAVIDRYNAYWNWYYVIIAAMLNILLVVEILFMRSIEKKVTKPIQLLDNVLEEYTAHEEEGLDSETAISRCRPYRYGYGEVSSLTRTFVNMVGEIDNYTENLKQVTAEKGRISAELDVASKIQRSMLPSIFPPFPDHPMIDLYASMTPAKEVGGDFYDFYLIDNDHLVLTIADVSGKGVPASLFMVISKTLLKNYAQTGASPKDVLTFVNHQLCQNNDSMMFCTVWLGILDLTSGALTAANAGHEYPAIRKKDGTYELIVKKHDPAIGVRDGLRFHEYELMLSPGDTLFQYTDGVTEATTASYELFDEEGLLQALNRNPDTSAQATISHVYDAINAFVKDAPQFDDITMLCLTYRGNTENDASNQTQITVPARIDRLDEVTAFIEEQLEKVSCSEDDLFFINLAVEEIFVNIANYAYEGGEGDVELSFSFDEDERIASFTLTDSGLPFDPTRTQEPDITQKASERKIGGMGIHLVRKTMDEVDYQYNRGRNVLTIKKKI